MEGTAFLPEKVSLDCITSVPHDAYGVFLFGLANGLGRTVIETFLTQTYLISDNAEKITTFSNLAQTNQESSKKASSAQLDSLNTQRAEQVYRGRIVLAGFQRYNTLQTRSHRRLSLREISETS